MASESASAAGPASPDGRREILAPLGYESRWFDPVTRRPAADLDADSALSPARSEVIHEEVNYILTWGDVQASEKSISMKPGDGEGYGRLFWIIVSGRPLGEIWNIPEIKRRRGETIHNRASTCHRFPFAQNMKTKIGMSASSWLGGGRRRGMD